MNSWTRDQKLMVAGIVVALFVGATQCVVAVAQPEIRATLKNLFQNLFHTEGSNTATVTPSPLESQSPPPSATNKTPEPAPGSEPTATPAEDVTRERYQLELYDGFDSEADVQQDVMELQTLLNKHGYSLEVDGLFGLATEEAVRQFQSEHGLQEDGIVGTETWAALLAN